MPSALSLVTSPNGDQNQDAAARRCTFSRLRGRWTLQADCELSAALDIPGNITLDGDGHTISLTGDAERFGSAAIRASGANVVNLTVDGSKLLPGAPAYFAAIALAAPGRISDTIVRDVHFVGAPHSAVGIEVAAFGYATTVLEDVTLSNVSGVGMLLIGDGQVTLERVRTDAVNAAVQSGGTIAATLSHAEFTSSRIGVLAQDQSRVRIVDSNSTGDRIAEDEALIHEDTLTFIGAGDRRQGRRRTLASTGRGRLS